jgi:EpsI family protein
MSGRHPRLIILMAALLGAASLPPLLKLGNGASGAAKTTNMANMAKAASIPDLQRLVPPGFSEWQEEPGSPLAVIAPEALKSMNKTYESTVSRVYRHSSGQRIMLMLAYGSNQLRQKTEAHQPEYCYAAYGFAVQHLGRHSITLASGSVPVIRLNAQKQSRHELVTYWLTLDGHALTPGWHRKFEQIRRGLLAAPTDGMLVRISSLAAGGATSTADFSPHQQFAADWLAALPDGHNVH